MSRFRASGSRRIAVALFLSTALSTAALAAPAHAQSEDDKIAAFFDGGYQYCDAKMLGALWNVDFYEAKLQVGAKLLNGLQDNMPAILKAARSNTRARCDWSDLSYSYEDAQTLASAWGLKSVAAAKTKAARLATQGRYDLIDRNLQGY